MALSNMLREPRREITESLVGAGIIGGPIGAVWLFGLWWHSEWPPDSVWGGMLMGLLCLSGLAVAIWLIVGVTVVLHEMGDAVCTALQARGVHLRPKQRY